MIGCLIFFLTFSACSAVGETATETITKTAVEISETLAVTSTPTPFTPSATPLPLAARVNGEELSLEAYEIELTRFRGTVGTGLATYGEEKVLEDLIDQILLAQAAANEGFSVDDALVATRFENLGLSEQELADWMTTQGYTTASLNQSMKQAIAAAWMRDQITAVVPDIAEQVHARQFLLYNSEEAAKIYDQLETGTDFGTLLEEYEPLTKGDLGWFPRGYLTVPELDDVIFSLQPGEYSPISETALGFHIIQVLEYDSNRQLSSGAYKSIQIQALSQWLENQRNQSDIEIYLP